MYLYVIKDRYISSRYTVENAYNYILFKIINKIVIKQELLNIIKFSRYRIKIIFVFGIKDTLIKINKKNH